MPERIYRIRLLLAFFRRDKITYQELEKLVPQPYLNNILKGYLEKQVVKKEGNFYMLEGV